MRASAAVALLLWQLGSAAAPSPSRHLRYEREIDLAGSLPHQACLALDADVFAHTESSGAGDIRIFGRQGQREFEVPFALTESGPAMLDAEPATVGNIAVQDGALTFDLAMPAGDYTEVVLQLNATNFVGAAQVAGIAATHRRVPLGTFAVFDLRSEGLARSTVLALPDSNYPLLHIELRLFTPEGQPIALTTSALVGAMVPPSGQEQTAYTTVASTSAVEQQGHWSTAALVVPAHVPIERARFVPQPDFRGDFLRNATIAATPLEKGWLATGAAEGVSGDIFRVTRGAAANLPPIDSQVLTVNTVIGSNLRSAAKVTATLDNGSSPPLPIERVDLQMRERKLCFEARPAVEYTLRYGDADLSAPSYTYARRFVPAAKPLVSALAAEQQNPNYVRPGTGDEHGRPGRDLPWVLLIAAIAVTGVFALQYVRQKGEGPG